jgi:peptidoglycan/LPS O-acetylase OafA/YrhL
VVSFLALAGNLACAAHGFPASMIGPLWSVSLEEQFYLLWPWVLRRVSARRLVGVAVGMVATSMLVRAGVAQAGLRYEAIWCNTAARLDPLALGALLALAYRARPGWLGPAARLLCAAGALALWALVSRYAGLVPSPRPLGAVLGYLGQALAGALALAAALSPARPSWLGARPLAYLGRISYGLYVFHPLPLVLAGPVPGLALTVAAAHLSYTYFESWFLRRKEGLSFARPGRPGPAAAPPG